MAKPADKDILEVLAEIEEDIEDYAEVNDREDDGELRKMRRHETLIRRLAREAGYQL